MTTFTRMNKGCFLLILMLLIAHSGFTSPLQTGAERSDLYLPLLQNKRVGLVVNQTSVVDSIHLVDFLRIHQIDVRMIFAPEHGFRGTHEAGAAVSNGKDSQTGIPVISLYGSSKKPTDKQLAGIDVLVFDIQDVGCRFYTYISTMHLVMEACAANKKPLIILDRPNPNGDYVAGPVLDRKFQSFVGMDPIPVVHGCTVGELARMINGERWLRDSLRCKLTVIPVASYDHSMRYSVPIPPSPNLPNDRAIRLYPSLCFFEATTMSIGRGTPFPFQVIGFPDKRFGSFSFTPERIPGVSLNPLHEGETCYGEDLRNLDEIPTFTIKYFFAYYQLFLNESDFLISESFLDKLAGTDDLILKIREGYSANELAYQWEAQLKDYKEMRKKYLLYPDFE